MKRERTPMHRPTVIIMIVLIVLFVIGVATRWGYIRKEVGETVNRMFYTGED